MIRNYLFTAFRNLVRYKGFSLINILGLTLSMSVCMLIIVVILDQMSYDKMHTKHDTIYRIITKDSLEAVNLRMAATPYPLVYELTEKYPFAEEVVVLNNSFNGEGVKDNTRISLNGLYTNSNFFRVFDFTLKNVPPEGILDNPYTIILTEETAEKFYGEEDPVGQFLQVDSLGSFRINGVISATKQKSHIQFDALISASTFEAIENAEEEPDIINDWDSFWSSWIYLLLPQDADMDNIQAVLNDISRDKYKGNEEHNCSFSLQPLDKVAPGPLLGNELGFFLPKVFVLFLIGLSAVIIISAAFNYTSLSVARSLLRAKEVGVRKTIGASRNQIITQFLLEAIVITFLSLILAYMLLQYLLPAFSGMQMMSLLEIRPEQNLVMYLWFFIFALITALLSGLLPSVFISAFRPVNVLKGITNVRFFSRLTLRKILLVTQFVFSMVFVISILLLFRQMNFMINAEMGFDREVVYNIRLQGHEFSRIKDEFSQLPEIAAISPSSHLPGVGNIWGVDIRLNFEDEKYNGNWFSVDENYIETMGLTLLAGENFPDNMSTENEKFVIINEKAVEHFLLGTPTEALGTSMILNDSTLVEVIGVMKDYYYAAMFMNTRPMLLRVVPGSYNYAMLRLDTKNVPVTMNKIERTWNTIDPDHELDGDFLDAEIRYYYSFFEDVLYTVGFASLLALLIAGLGLLGMATYSTQTRTKEIGIRKVFGAEVPGILVLISRSYLWLMIIAALIGGPLAYFINKIWLDYMANRVDFGAGTVLAGVLIVALIGLITILSQTFRAARLKPADTLQYE